MTNALIRSNCINYVKFLIKSMNKTMDKCFDKIKQHKICTVFYSLWLKQHTNALIRINSRIYVKFRIKSINKTSDKWWNYKICTPTVSNKIYLRNNLQMP